MRNTIRSQLRNSILAVAALLSVMPTMQGGFCFEGHAFKAGAALVNINPVGLPVQSNGSMTPRLADSVHDDLQARCLVLDNGDSKVALVVCDSCMIPREVFDSAKQLASHETGIPAKHILCSATHTHSGVSVAAVFQSEVEKEYSELLAQRISEGIIQADAQREPARIGWALGHAPQHVFNRRWFLRPGVKNGDPFNRGNDQVRMNPPSNDRDLLRPAGPTDPQVPILAVQSLDGHPIAVWANYSLHYVGGIPGNALSADYFGEFARQFESQLSKSGQTTPTGKPPVVIAMTNGTSGDVNNVNFYSGSGLQSPFEQIRLVASDLAQAAHIAYQRVDYQDWIPLVVKEEEVEVGVRKPTSAEVATAKKVLVDAGSPPWSTLPAIYANETVQLAEYPETVKLKLQVIRLGDLGVAAIPCETFVETGLALKSRSSLQPMFTIELANGYNGYLPTPQQHALGGYETWRAKSSYLAVDAEPQIVSTLLRLLDEASSDGSPTRPGPAQNDASNLRLQPTDALSVIESTRGGRHWVDQPTALPKSADESLNCFQIEPGAEIELVAAEPLVFDPVWITFDEFGRMFVAEYADYPSGPTKDQAPPLSRIVMLEDSDGNGKMDRRHVFADELNFAHSMMAFRNGLLVGTKDTIVYLKDTDGDLRADVREVLFSGFQSPHPQMQIGCPQWGIDNWIYFNYGPGKITRASPESLRALFGSLPISQGPIGLGALGLGQRGLGHSEQLLPNKDFRFHPSTFAFGPASGFGQFGNTIDRSGHRFFCTNRNPIMLAPISQELLKRNRFLTFAEEQYDVAPSGDQSTIFPIVEMKSNYLSHAGTYTAACGTTAYIGDLFGGQFADSIFVCEPIGHLISRYVVQPVGSQMVARRAQENAEFLVSTDNWFRPASLACGPEGALYVADMSRLWVEHPQFLPADVASKMDWRAGENQGRIWRIIPAGDRRPAEAFRPVTAPDELVAMLNHPNGWRQQLAQRLLVERRSEESVVLLRNLLDEDKDELATQRSLWVLHGQEALTAQDVTRGLQSTHPTVRESAVQLARGFLADENVLDNVLRSAGDQSAQVRFQAALTLGDVSHKRSTLALARIAASDSAQRWTNTAILTSAAGRSSELLVALRAMRCRDSSPPDPETIRLVRQLAECTGAEGDSWQLAVLLSFIASQDSPFDWWKLNSLSGLTTGFKRYHGDKGKLTLSLLIEQPPSWLLADTKAIQQCLQRLPDLARDLAVPTSTRVAAIELIGSLPSNSAEDFFQMLLDSSQPGDVQLAAIRSLRSVCPQGWAERIIASWSLLGPRVRAECLTLLLADTASARSTLQAMLEHGLEPALVTVDQRAMLLSHPNPEILQLAQRVLGSGITADRQSVVRDYWSALSLAGNHQAGQAVFDRVCASCHRISGRGHQVGPDLSDSRNRSREAILVDLLDPNQRIDPQYLAYQILTVDGQLFQGLLLSESSDNLVLRLAGGQERTVLRSEIEQLKVGGKSLMPDGVEKDVSPQQMADLLEFLKPSQADSRPEQASKK